MRKSASERLQISRERLSEAAPSLTHEGLGCVPSLIHSQREFVTHQFLECSVNGLLLPQVAIVECNLLATEKKIAGNRHGNF